MLFGFGEESIKRNPREGEPPETRSLEKKALFDMLNVLYFLPPYGGRAVTRDYLLQVYRGTVFRVNNATLRHFEADLTPPLTKRNGDPNNGLLVKKLNILLESRGDASLGFSHYEPPDTVRFI